VPLPERFFSGGVISNRGFALNQAGPRDLITGFPVGGNAVFVNSIELRLPPPTLPIVGNNLSFVLFNDSGNVFQNATTMGHSLFRWYQPNRKACSDEKQHEQCRFDYMSTAMGTGIRYKTPIGPARVDFSYNLNPSSFPYYVQCPGTSTKPCGVIPPGTTVFQHGTLRHFNFFFSIGQTF
jgi:outer membrane protein assembly factor BamA